ncbi:MAG TPA: glycosyltransferase family 9 protein [Thermoanaerobaculia bacterium]
MRPVLRAVRRIGRKTAAGALETAVRVAAAASPGSAEPPREPRSVFVLRNNDVGDLLVVTPLFEALRRRFPEARIAAGVGSWNLDVLRHNPHVSELLPVNAPWFNKYQGTAGPLDRLAYLARSPEVREVAARRFEVGIDVLGSAWGSLLLLRACIPCRLGVHGYAGGHSAAQAVVTFDPAEHVGRSALRFAELLGAADLPPNRPQLFLAPQEQEEGERWWAAGEQGRRTRRLVIAPGGGLVEKRWPVESFAALAAALAGVEELSVLVLGGPRERNLVEPVAAALPRVRTFAEPPGLRQVFALLAACDLVVCNSSMPLHVATAFGKPTVVLLGEAFPSAIAHQAQWGYPGLSVSLGKEPGMRERLASPEEAREAVQQVLESAVLER